MKLLPGHDTAFHLAGQGTDFGLSHLQEVLDAEEDPHSAQISLVNQDGAVMADVDITLQVLKALQPILTA